MAGKNPDPELPNYAAELAVGSDFKQEIWESYNDAGLVATLSVKLEAVLTAVLAQSCHHISEDLIHYYHAKYPGDADMENFTRELNDHQYLKILKQRCKPTLGNLIFEVFTKSIHDRGFKWKTPAEYWGFKNAEKLKFKAINKLRDIVHYGIRSDGTYKLGTLFIGRRKEMGKNGKMIDVDVDVDERKSLMKDFRWIINSSKSFRVAFPVKGNQVGQVSWLIWLCVDSSIPYNFEDKWGILFDQGVSLSFVRPTQNNY